MSRRSHRHGERTHARAHRPETARPAAAVGPTAGVEAVAPPAAAEAVAPPAQAEALAPSAATIPASAARLPMATASIAPLANIPAVVAGPLEGPAPVTAPAGLADPGPDPTDAFTLAAGTPNGHVPEEPAASGLPEVGRAISVSNGVGPSRAPTAVADVASAGPSDPPSVGTDRIGVLAGCTAPQLRRFIKSRAYLPMHELRRRFAIEGPDDDVAAIELDGTRVYVGLPEREGRLLGELLRGGDVGFELSHDPATPVIVGVYPMRPVPRS